LKLGERKEGGSDAVWVGEIAEAWQFRDQGPAKELSTQQQELQALIDISVQKVYAWLRSWKSLAACPSRNQSITAQRWLLTLLRIWIWLLYPVPETGGTDE